ncbi:PREDICTED: butyrophilin subfamily 1 member A1-like [Chrysochloris asiatica]|uniref:Butyrophilin subfamily 1 member A1-like n=1 Tax=Chrysochloris asiatica TaxID=185453 RepID=A0A9B0X0Y3_CHRAS|nr:PREDICTED: butyrophilin subfamily 1 member A1-like [Chrysochloris asiatica]
MRIAYPFFNGDHNCDTHPVQLLLPGNEFTLELIAKAKGNSKLCCSRVNYSLPRQFHVIGPKTSVTVLVGEEAVFSCHLSPPVDAQKMEVKWYRDHPSNILYHYKNFQHHMEQQSPEYQRRTELLGENMNKGQVSVRILHIRPSDEGVYKCLFINSTYYNEAQFQVWVIGPGTVPHIYIEHGKAKEIKLTCTSIGWYPQPEVQWSDQQGQNLATALETKITEDDGLYHVETSIMVDKDSKGSVSCFIRNSFFNVEKEAHISLSGQFPPKSSS